MFVDYTREKLEVVDPSQRRTKKISLVVILGASQLTYVEAVERPTGRRFYWLL